MEQVPCSLPDLLPDSITLSQPLSLSLVVNVVMMKSKELKTKISHAHSLILSRNLSIFLSVHAVHVHAVRASLCAVLRQKNTTRG